VPTSEPGVTEPGVTEKGITEEGITEHTVTEAVAARPRRTSAVRRLWPPGLVIAALLGVWALLTDVVGVEDYILPAPDEVFLTMFERWDRTLRSATWITFIEVVVGFLVSVVAGLVTGCLLHLFGFARRALYPLLIGSQSVPLVVMAPILAIVLGYSVTPKLVLVALICFFPVVVATVDGLSSVDPALIRLMRTLYGTRWSIFRKVEFPAALPTTFTGLRLAAAYAATGAVFGEYAGATDGLGHVMRQAVPQLETALVFAAIVLLAAMSLALFALVCLLERFLLPWAHEGGAR
jgi:putative hydroxymethylpyrimidine transport system permease protein